MKPALFASVAVSALFGAASAMAGNLAEPVEPPVIVQPTPMPEPVSDWTGFYLGAELGRGNASFDVSGTASPIVDTYDDEDFTFGGLIAGYMYDFGRFVVGGELSYDAVDYNDVNNDGDLRRTGLALRAGYDAGNLLPYFSVGGVNLQDRNNDDFDEDGYSLGLGVDYKFNDNFIVGAQYSRNVFEDVFEDSFTGGDSADLTTDEIGLRVSYQF